jgi:hypothetical protein
MQLMHTQQHNSKEKVPDATMNEIEVRWGEVEVDLAHHYISPHTS